MRNKANFYIEQGRAEIMEWGSDDFIKAYDGGVILEGDTVQTKSSSRGVLVLYNGTEVRFDESTEVTIETLQNHGDEDELVLDIEKGQIWVKQTVSDKGTVDIMVKTDNINIYSGASQYAVSDKGEQSVRVIEGSAEVELVERDGKDIVIDEVSVGVGQQLYMSSSDVVDLIARRNMSFVEAVSDSFKETEFYKWNMTYEFEESEIVPSEVDPSSDELEDEVVEEEEEEYEDPELSLTNPETTPYLLEGDQIYITGEVTGYASKIVVTSYLEDGTAEPYQLSLFEPGDTEWSYNAAISYENLREGENEFVVTAYGDDGYEADVLYVTINVTSEVDPSSDESEDDSEEGEEEEVPELACGDVTVPEVLTVGGEDWAGEIYSTEEGYVSVTGSVECAYAIEINGYQLTLFEPGSTSWSYTADPSFDNLFEGENTYEVVAIDEEGNRSEAAVFVIDYSPASEETE